MITKDAINNAWESFRTLLSVSDREKARDMKTLSEQLLKERDELVTKCHRLEEQLKNIPDWDEVSRRNKEIIQLRKELTREKIQHEKAEIEFTKLNNELLAELKQEKEKSGVYRQMAMGFLKATTMKNHAEEMVDAEAQRIIEQRNQSN